MDAPKSASQNGDVEPKYLNFPHLNGDASENGKPALNRYSHTLTNGHDFPGAQVTTICVSPVLSQPDEHLGDALCGGST